MFLVIILSWSNSSCLCTIHMPPLSVSQPVIDNVYVVREMKQQREPNSVCTGQFWNEQDCLFVGNTCTLATQSSVGGFLRVHPEGWWRWGCGDGFPVGCVLPLNTPNSPPPPPAVVITSLFRPILHHFSFNHRHSVPRRWNTILLLINFNDLVS